MEEGEYDDGGGTPLQDEPSFDYDESAILEDMDSNASPKNGSNIGGSPKKNGNEDEDGEVNDTDEEDNKDMEQGEISDGEIEDTNQDDDGDRVNEIDNGEQHDDDNDNDSDSGEIMDKVENTGGADSDGEVASDDPGTPQSAVSDAMGPSSPAGNSTPASSVGGPATPLQDEDQQSPEEHSNLDSDQGPASPVEDIEPASPDNDDSNQGAIFSHEADSNNPESPHTDHSNHPAVSHGHSDVEHGSNNSNQGPASPVGNQDSDNEGEHHSQNLTSSNLTNDEQNAEGEAKDEVSQRDEEEPARTPTQDEPDSVVQQESINSPSNNEVTPSSPHEDYMPTEVTVGADTPASPVQEVADGPESPPNEDVQSPGSRTLAGSQEVIATEVEAHERPASPSDFGPASPDDEFEGFKPSADTSEQVHEDTEETHETVSQNDDVVQRSSPVVDDSDEEFEGFEAPVKPTDEEENKGVERKGSDDEGSDKESADELIADIFGSSDEEDFEGFGKDAVGTPKKKKENAISDDEEGGALDEDAEVGQGEAEGQALPASDDSDDEMVKEGAQDFVSDFDMMMDKKKEENQKRRRRRKNEDIINDNDDLIADLIKKMKETAEEDRTLNQQNKPAVKKLSLLTLVKAQLKKSDLLNAFVDCGVLAAITEWLAPLPDRSLPHLQIRSELLHCLQNFPTISSEGLKSSGIGKAIMYLYKHPKEIKNNKLLAGKLINEWSRPIFSLSANYKALSKEEREQRDYDQLPKRRRISSDGGKTPRRDIEKALAHDPLKKGLNPGDAGFVMRARVPRPSTKDYVVRPQREIDESDMPRRSSKKTLTRYEKKMREFQEKKKRNKSQRAVPISIQGRKMGI